MQPPPIVVIGGSLAGLAAAARLAKLRHPVLVLESADRLGGRYAERLEAGEVVDDLPGMITFPAPWRDLFHKTGRDLDVVLARAGLALVPAPAARHRFTDGTELVLAADRGAQQAQIARTYGEPAASRWRELIDHLGDVWQVVRGLGLEQDLTSARQIDASGLRRLIRPGRTIERLARDIDEPHLAQIIAGIAWRQGSVPGRTPAWCAVQLSIERTFGRWMMTAVEDDAIAAEGPVRTGTLIDALADRLALRAVDVLTGCRVTAIRPAGETPGDGFWLDTVGGPVAGAGSSSSAVRAGAVVAAVNPWSLAALTSGLPGGRVHRTALRRLRPANAPRISHRAEPVGDHGVVGTDATEEIRHTETGPVITWTRPVGTTRLVSTHDWSAAHPDPAAGVAWQGDRGWLRRPAIRTPTRGLYSVGPHSRGGGWPSAEVLSGALAAYACHTDLTGIDPNPYAPGN